MKPDDWVRRSSMALVRRPLLPVEELDDLLAVLVGCKPSDPEFGREVLVAVRAICQRHPMFIEAVWLSSPQFAESWLLPSSLSKGVVPPKVAQALIRYVSRASRRATPFGAFAGYSVAQIGDRCSFPVDVANAIRTVRLSTILVHEVSERIVADSEVRATLKVRTNATLWATPEVYRYTKRKVAMERVECVAASVKRSRLLDAVIRLAEQPIRYCALLELLRAEECGIDESTHFLDELIARDVLVTELTSDGVGEHPQARVLDVLKQAMDGSTLCQHFSEAVEGYAKLRQSSTQEALSVYLATSRSLSSVGLSSPPPHVTWRQGDRVVIGAADVQRVFQGVCALRDYTYQERRSQQSIARFSSMFVARFGDELVPLLQALDPLYGVPYGSDRVEEPIVGLLRREEDRVYRGSSARERTLLAAVSRVLRSGDDELDLQETEYDSMKGSLVPKHLPDSFAAKVVFLPPDGCQGGKNGVPMIWLQVAAGPSCARWIGRFADGDDELADKLRSLLDGGACSGELEALAVEVPIMLPPKWASVGVRPRLGGGLFSTTVPSAHVENTVESHVEFRDVLVGVRDGEVVLFHRATGIQLNPRLSNAVSALQSGSRLIEFLCDVQDVSGFVLSWDWGALSSMCWLPRVRHGNVVLSPQRWRLSSEEGSELVSAARAGDSSSLELIRWKYRLPAQVGVVSGEDVLTVDLSSCASVCSATSLIQSADGCVLYECLEVGRFAGKDDTGRVFAHEAIIPFVSSDSRARPMRMAKPFGDTVRRSSCIGDSMLYWRIDANSVAADYVVDRLGRLADRLVEEGRVEWWFFVRYRDPNHHVRFRIRVASGTLPSEVLSLTSAEIDQLRADGLCGTVSLETYVPETLRYGGDSGLSTSELIFWRDSASIRRLLVAGGLGTSTDSRWLLGVSLLERWLDYFTVPVEFRSDRLYELAGIHSGTPDARRLERRANALFREHHRRIEDAVAGRVGGLSTESLQEVFLERDRELLPLVVRMLNGVEQKSNRARLLGSFSHMCLNRLLRSSHAEQEPLLCLLLRRHHMAGMNRRPFARDVPV
jgi:lantibiotic biosynthesis protein